MVEALVILWPAGDPFTAFSNGVHQLYLSVEYGCLPKICMTSASLWLTLLPDCKLLCMDSQETLVDRQ